jgi:multidrug resistance efflux pump
MVEQITSIDPLFVKETFLSTRTVKTKAIYIVVIFAILIVLVLLPIIKVSLSVQSRGIIRPVTEKTEIKAMQSELVNQIFIREGMHVNKGDTLLVFRNDILQSKIQFLQSEFEKIEQYIIDLNILVKKSKGNIKSGLYTQQQTLHKKKISELDLRIDKARKEQQRNKLLYEKQLIPEKDYDDLTFNLTLLKKEKSILQSTQIGEWKSDLARYSSELKNQYNQLKQLVKENELYVIISPVSGTVEEFSGIYPGSLLQGGQTIAVLSPKSDIVAELYISAKDIGYIQQGQKAKIQIDAFDYNEWGIIEGNIISISEDYVLLDNTPVFKVKCKLNNQYLELNNGVKGTLKKGMTVNARFMIAKRSLFQLLYQKSDDWLNPSRNLVSQN